MSQGGVGELDREQLDQLARHFDEAVTFSKHIKAKVEDLNTKSQAMGHAVYASEQANANAAGSAGAQDGSPHAGESAGTSGAADDDVVDAEVVDDEEVKDAK